ncbi:mitochondrial dicarboxylate carrier-like protein [Leptotrombidium deliense]|uniref:Mitochondrial dicarboxylate carrier-like protein n=1 Tax=Leptotrombidium deliense TaxID=299467 RepID=A0A443SB25_9ACAR|nr:mitochondrial dicarboxylate carrier-like protein [Leptotrombidium deliense]
MSAVKSERERRVARWYYGGLASAGAAMCTHPLDLLKVHLQTASVPVTNAGTASLAAKQSLVTTTAHIIRKQGVLALYNGLSASLLRQLTYSTTRFGMYETLKKKLIESDTSTNKQNVANIPFYQKVLLAAVSGAVGGLFGVPADMVNVRMQNDIKLPIEKRRNYKHAIDGLIRVYQHEGFKTLFSGATMATSRAVLMTIGQLSMYDQFKYFLLTYAANYFGDDLITHFTASLSAAGVATTFTQPLDVMKTRLMNASKSEYKSIMQCGSQIFREHGLLGFFKGKPNKCYVPAFVRLGPQTVLTFIFFEQLRLNFGDLPKSK